MGRERASEREYVNLVSLAARFYPGLSEILLNLMKVDGPDRFNSLARLLPRFHILFFAAARSVTRQLSVSYDRAALYFSRDRELRIT